VPRRKRPINDLDLTCWQDYKEVLTDSLWLLGRRDNDGMHTPEYWGNFVPQVPGRPSFASPAGGRWWWTPLQAWAPP